MVRSRLSTRIAQRHVKNDAPSHETESDHHNDASLPMAPHAGHLRDTPKKGHQLSHRRSHITLSSSPSSMEDDDVYDGDSVDDIDDDDDDDDNELIIASPLKRRNASISGHLSQFRQKRPPIGEVDSARSKLDDVLAHISKGDSQDDDDDNDDDTDSSPQMKRRRSRGQRKIIIKGRKETDGFVKPSSFVLKLFDRSVDLAQFSFNTTSDDAALYPVCRSWIRNHSQLPKLYEPPSIPVNENHDIETAGPNDDKPPGIYHLPKPTLKPKDKYDCEIDLRIPEYVRNYQKSKSQVDIEINSLADDSFSTLINKNITRWKEVRREWRNAAFQNEHRYKHSCDVLKAMYERSVSGQTDADQIPKTSNE